jgi:hypothetical protein
MNWKGFGMKRSWPIQVVFLNFSGGAEKNLEIYVDSLSQAQI